MHPPRRPHFTILPQKFLPNRNQIFKYMSLCRTFSFTSPQGGIFYIRLYWMWEVYVYIEYILRWKKWFEFVFKRKLYFYLEFFACLQLVKWCGLWLCGWFYLSLEIPHDQEFTQSKSYYWWIILCQLDLSYSHLWRRNLN